MFRHLCLLCVFVLVCENEAARILAYYPLPFISHQVVFRPLSLELAKRGHDVIVMTPDPMFPKGGGPKNLKEIDLHELSYTAWNNALKKINANFDSTHFSFIARVTSGIIEDQLKSVEVQKLLTNKSESFDLVIVEAFAEQGLGLAHHFKTPVIQFSSMGVIVESYKIYGAPIHPFLYPTPFHDRVYNLTILEKLHELYKQYDFQQVIPRNLELYDDMLKRVFGPDVPKFVELRKDVDLLFLNVHASWDFNRPVPPNIVYLGGMHQKPKEDLPEDLKKYLDSSKNGVIYVSFGTNVDPALFPPEKIQALVKVFSKLPYDILWKWNHDELPGRTENIRISKWLPQSDLLRHPKVKLFVTQGGLQSTDEAITAEIPLLGIPIYADQNFNVELYLHYKLGERVELESLNEDTLSKAIDKLLTDDSYRKNVAKLHAIMTDQPQTPLERAVWWTEYVIRHKGAKHLRSPAAGMSLTEYFEVELIAYLVLGLSLVVSVVCYLVIFVCSCLFGRKEKVKKN